MELNDAAQAMSTLGQSARLEVFRLLVKAGSGGACAGDLAREMKIPKNTLSFHLKELSRTHLVTSEREGRSIIYRLHEESVRNLIGFLTEECCQGRPELCLPVCEENGSSLDPREHSTSTQTRNQMNAQRNILFLCNHNSARSQMAEALLQSENDPRFTVFSAGLDPRPLAEGAVRAMNEIGIDISSKESKSTKVFMGKEVIHYAIFLCSESEEDCPRIYPFANNSESWRIPAPSALAEEIGPEKAFREVRDTIQDKIRDWMEQLDQGSV